MTKRELLENYREIVRSIDLMEEEIAKHSSRKYIGGPKPVRGVQLTGMPRGTNDPEAAMLQTVSIEDEILQQIREKQAVQYEMMREFYKIIDAIQNDRLQNIIRSYYSLGKTDEQIAEYEGLSRQHVNRLRTAYIDSLT